LIPTQARSPRIAWKASSTAAALLALLFFAPPLPASAQYCPSGAITATCDAVLLICASFGSSDCTDIQSKLRDTGAFSTVDTFDARSASYGGSGTPTASHLAAYHAVLAFCSDQGFADRDLLGDRLAAYHDQGGGVVVANSVHSISLGGAYGDVANGYALLDYAQWGEILPSDSLGDVLEPQSPLMYGVTALSAEFAFRNTAPIIAGRSVVVARWRGGGQEPLVLRGTRGGRTLVELNFYPPSIGVHYALWTGDGAALLRNGLKYSRCIIMSCGPGSYTDAG
jgi:hypothetical protein